LRRAVTQMIRGTALPLKGVGRYRGSSLMQAELPVEPRTPPPL